MCGRFTLTADALELEQEFYLAELPANLSPRFNIAPSQPVAVVKDAEKRLVDWMAWGLVPSWAKDPSIGNQMINARSETIRIKPAFRQSFTKRRCLILADGFFEWQKPQDKKSGSQPFYFRLANQHPFAFAGLWDIYRPLQGDPLLSCTIITCPANTLVAKYHERMPVIMDYKTGISWLEGTSPYLLEKLLIPYPPELMIVYPVTRRVNDPHIDDKHCIEPIPDSK